MSKRTLRFSKDGIFKILMFGDTHGCAPSRDLFDPQIKDDVAKLIDATSPDLVIMSGDITGGRRGVATPEELRAFLDWFIPAIEERGVPWAHVYGNHDSEDGCDPVSNPGVPRAVQQTIYESYELCLSQAGPESIHGVGNYVLHVLGSNCDEPRFLVWGLDSGQEADDHEREYGYSGAFLPSMGARNYDGVRFDQVCWYRAESEAIEHRYGRKIPGLMYFHIPLPEHVLVIENPEKCGMTGSFADFQLKYKLFASAVNSGLFASVLERGDVRGIYCGHAHHTDFEGTYCGIKLGCDGAVTYKNSGVDENWLGGRVFYIDESDPAAFTSRFVRVSEC